MRRLTPFSLLIAATLILFGVWSCALVVGVLAAMDALSTDEEAPRVAVLPIAEPIKEAPRAAIPPIAEQIAAVDETRLLLSVNRLANTQNRHALAPPHAGIHAARDLLLAEFETLRAANPATPMLVFPHVFQFTFHEQPAIGENVVLLIPGTDPEAGAVVIGAHYDTRSEDIRAHDTIQPGADDNASGVAAVLEIARILAVYPHRATVYLVLFAAEEEGRFGSQAFVRDVVQAQNIPLSAMINLDMIGVSTGPDGGFLGGFMRAYSAPPDDSPSRELARQIAQAAQLYIPEMTVIVHDTLDRPGRWGDHQSFSDAGYAAARLIEPADDPARTHTTGDLPDLLDLAYLRRVTQVTLAAVLVLAD